MPFLTKREDLILLATWHLKDDAHGATIRNYLSDTTDHDWSIAGVYAPLKRLASAGLVSTYVGAPTDDREGRSKRHYRLTDAGMAVLREGQRLYESMWKDLPGFALGN